MAEESKAPIVRTMTKAHFRALCDAEFRSYMLDEENPIMRLSKRIAQLQKEIDETAKESEVYEKTISLIVKHHEMFLHRTGTLPKQNTRTVGVNVNISSPPELQPSLLRSTLSNQISITPISTPVKSEPGVSRPKTRSSVDYVDLTEEDESQKKLRLAKSAYYGKVVPDKTVVKAPNVTMETSLTAQRTYSRSTDNISTLNVVPTVTGLPPMMQFAQLPPGIIRSVSNPNINAPQIAYMLNRGHPQPVQMVSRFGPPGTVLLPYPGRMIRPLFRAVTIPRHPAPLPAMPKYLDRPFDHPMKPTLSLTKPAEGIVLSWDMNPKPTDRNPIKVYEIYSYEEPAGPTTTIDTSLWKKVGEVAAMPLPMACTLTQCSPGRRYHFAIRACDPQERVGPWSDVTSILLPPGSK